MTEARSPHGPRGRHRAPSPEITPEIKEGWQSRRSDFSAGGVAWRLCQDGYEVALIATRGGTRWQLPKGTCEPGESAEETALREVEEEVGLRTVSEGFLRTIEYWYWDTFQRPVAELVHKEVQFYLLRVVSGELTDNCIEVDATGWFTLAQAETMLTFDGEREVLRAARQILEARGDTGSAPA